MPPSEPDDLKRLGEKIDAVGKKHAGADPKAAPNSSLGIAFRFGTEMVAAVMVGGAMGWGIDWAFQNWAHIQTRPAGLVVMFILGAAAGIRNVWRVSRQLGAEAPKEK